MIEQVSEIDKIVTLMINGWNSPFFDQFFLEATHRFTWIPLYLSLIWFLYQSFGFSFWRALVIIVLLITVSDQMSSFVFKPFFERLRPCDDPLFAENIHIVNGYRAGGYSFFSSHASNCASLFTFVFLITRNKSVGFILFLWMLINSYSRIYLGVHYFTDVLFGVFVGVLLGVIGFRLFNLLYSDKMRCHNNLVANCIPLIVFMCTIAYLLILKSID